MNRGDVCLADCATKHIILRHKKYFLYLTLTNVNVCAISSTANLIKGFERANIMLPNGIRFHINDALYSSKSKMNFLSFKDIYINSYHIETMNEGNTKCLYITFIVSSKKLIMEKLSAFSFGLYHTNMKSIRVICCRGPEVQ